MANTKLPARLLDTSAIPALNVTGDLTVDTNTLKVDSTNNRVGIGKSSPNGKLHIKSAGTGNVLYVESSDGHHLGGFYQESDTRAAFNVRDASGSVKVNLDAGDSSWFTGGNVGIGTAQPADRLHVALDSSTTNAEVEVMRVEATSSGTPAVGFGPFIDFRGDRINGGPDSYGRLGFEADSMPSTTVDGAFIVQTAEDGTYSERMRISSDGKVGIGTGSPQAPLHVYNSSGGDATNKAGMLSEAVLKLQPHASNSTNMLVAQVDGGSSMGIQVTNGPATANWDLSLSPFGGNVGIGTVDPAYALEVKKSVNGDWLSRIYNTSTTDGSGLLVRSDTANSQATTIFGVYGGGSYKMKVRGDGTVTQPNQPTAIYTHTANSEDGAYYKTFATTGAQTVIARPQTAVVNRGSMYNPSNGRFTAPQAGVYRYAVHGNLYTSALHANAYWTWQIYKNTAHYIYHYESNSTRAANGWIYINCGGIIEMAATDYLRFQLKTNNLSATVGFGMDLAAYTHYEFQLLY